MIPHYVNPSRSDNNAFLLGFCKAVYRNDIEAALEHMRTYMATIPYDLENHSEKHYQTIFYLMFSFLNIYIRTEVKSAIGRADAVMHMPDTIYVFELKVDKSADEALAQIDEKGAIAMRPTVINVMPSPCSGFGTHQSGYPLHP